MPTTESPPFPKRSVTSTLRLWHLTATVLVLALLFALPLPAFLVLGMLVGSFCGGYLAEWFVYPRSKLKHRVVGGFAGLGAAFFSAPEINAFMRDNVIRFLPGSLGRHGQTIHNLLNLTCMLLLAVLSGALLGWYLWFLDTHER